jgi:uncharacterized membrane protein (DUF485 family)
MNALKRILGIVWLLMGPVVLSLLVMEAIKKNTLPTSTTNDILQWSIIIGIFIPIAFGLVIFGIYSLKGAYDLED